MKRVDLRHGIDELLAGVVQPGGPGLVVGVARHGKTLYRRALGQAHIELGAPMTPRTLLPIASVSKHMTAACLLRLASDGLVDLDRPLGAYLPELAPACRAPTVRQLLTHQSGLRCHLDMGLFNGYDATWPDGFAMKTLTAMTTVNAEPGRWQVYGNGPYHLASRVIERVTGLTFAEAMTRHLFSPLNLRDTRVPPSAQTVTRGLASLYEPAGEGAWRNVSHMRAEVLGEGGVATTLDDLLAWTNALREEDSRLPSTVWTELKTRAVTADGRASNYALGLQVATWRGVDLITHGGTIFGASAMVLTAPTFGVDVVLIANTSVGVEELARKILVLVLGEAAFEAPPPRALAKDWPGADRGVFVSPHSVFAIARDEDRLSLMVQGVPGLPLSAAPDGEALTMAGSTGPIEVRFPDGPAGERAILLFGGEENLGVRSREAVEASDIPDDLIGVYANADLDARIELTRGGEGVRVKTIGPYGVMDAELSACAPDVFVGRSRLTIFILRPLREAGRVAGLTVSTTRTRDLPFARLSAPSHQT